MNRPVKIFITAFLLAFAFFMITNTAFADTESQIKCITEITLDKIEVTAPETITVEIDYENGIGFTNACIYFCAGDYQNEAYATLKDIGNGKLQGIIHTDGLASGVYFFDRICFEWYENGRFRRGENFYNSSHLKNYYFSEDRSSFSVWEFPESVQTLSFELYGQGTITECPYSIGDIEFVSTRAKVPTTIEIIVDILGKHESISDTTLKWASSEIKLSLEKDGKYHGTYYAGIGLSEDTFFAGELTITDTDGNKIKFVDNFYDSDDIQYLFPQSIRKKDIVLNTLRLDVIEDCSCGTSFCNDIICDPSDCFYHIDFEGRHNPVIPKELLDAYRNAGGRVICVGYNYTWTFDGANIDANTRDIDLTLSYYDAASSTEEVDAKIKAMVGLDKSAYIINFSDDGDLPGQSTIHLWLDDWAKLSLGLSEIKIYQYEDEHLKLKMNNVSITKDGYIEFQITDLNKVVLVGNGATVGNTNGDGAIDINDMQCLYEFLSTFVNCGKIEDTKCFEEVADVNGDNNVNILDYQALYEIVLFKRKTANIELSVPSYGTTLAKNAFGSYELSMSKGECFYIEVSGTDGAVSWYSDNSDVITVNSVGKIKCVANGSATIRCVIDEIIIPIKVNC